MCVCVSVRDEADEFVEIGALNGIFVLGRSMGFIGMAQCTQHNNMAVSQTELLIYLVM